MRPNNPGNRLNPLPMSSSPSSLVAKLWNYCHILRDDGLSYGDYVEQLTFLLFLKMADEQSHPPFNKSSAVLAGYDWPSLLARDGDELETHYRHVLETLGKEKGMLGIIFRKAQNKRPSCDGSSWILSTRNNGRAWMLT